MTLDHPIEIRRHRPESPWTYERLDARQREIAAACRLGEPGALLLSEVAPVITRGRRTAKADLLLSKKALQAQGIDLLETDRGGLATYHGPGQWIAFVVDRLERLTGDSRGVRTAVERLLSIALEVGQLYDPTAEIREGAELGVWTHQGKFASVGVHVERGVLLHGLAINGFCTETSFQGLRPCGLDLPVGFLLKDSSGFASLGEAIVAEAQAHFWRPSARAIWNAPQFGHPLSVDSHLGAGL